MAQYNVKLLGVKTVVEDTPENIQAYKDLRSVLDILFGPDEEGKTKKLRAYQVIEELITRDGDEVQIPE